MIGKEHQPDKKLLIPKPHQDVRITQEEEAERIWGNSDEKEENEQEN